MAPSTIYRPFCTSTTACVRMSPCACGLSALDQCTSNLAFHVDGTFVRLFQLWFDVLAGSLTQLEFSG